MVEVETPEAQSALQQVAQLECPHLMQPGWACWKQERASKAEQSGGCTAQNLLTLRKERGESASVLGFHSSASAAIPVRGRMPAETKPSGHLCVVQQQGKGRKIHILLS